MKILVAGLVKNIQLTRLKEEAEKRGHQLEGCYSTDLEAVVDAHNISITVKGKLFDYDLIYACAVGNKRRLEWYEALRYVARAKNVLVVNQAITASDYNFSPSPLLSYIEQLKLNLPFPKSAIVFNKRGLEQVSKEFTFPAILKSTTGHRGKEVFLVNSLDEAKNVIDTLNEKISSFVLREFIPNDGDIRIFCVGYKAIGAMKRTAPEGDFRSNISQGGTGEVFDLEANPSVRELAEKAAKATRVEIAGVDIMINRETGEPYILEVNPGPQIAGIESFTNLNVAGKIIEYFEDLYGKTN